jgi:hypothetical protein
MAKGNGTASKNGKGAPRRRRLRLYSRKPIEVAPGLTVATLIKTYAPRIEIERLHKMADGSYLPVEMSYENEIRITAAAKMLGVPYRTLLRLARAGFIKSTQIAPYSNFIVLSSWFEHVKAVRDNPNFWTKEKRKRYQQALF